MSYKCILLCISVFTEDRIRSYGGEMNRYGREKWNYSEG